MSESGRKWREVGNGAFIRGRIVMSGGGFCPTTSNLQCQTLYPQTFLADYTPKPSICQVSMLDIKPL